MTNLKNGILLAGSWLALAALMAGPAWAQDDSIGEEETTPPEDPDNDDDGVILVTATKRATQLQDTALAINALSTERLDSAAITDTAGLQTAVPTLQYSAGAGSSFVFLRGVGAVVFGTFSDNSIATYLDGAYVPRPTAAVQEFIDVERVEVLRGPQATLYGRNATGGAVLITSAAPSDRFTASGDARISNEGGRRFRAMVSGPLAGDQLAIRLSAVRTKHDGYSTNLVNGTGYDSQDYWGLRGSLRIRPADTLTLTFIGNYSEENGSPGTQKSVQNSLPFRTPPSGRGRPFSPNPRASYRNLAESNPAETYGGQLNVDWDLNFATLTSISSYQRYKIGPTFFDLDDSDLPLLEYRGQTGGTKFLFQDLYLTSAPGRVEWQVGATVSNEKTALTLPVQSPGGLSTSAHTTEVDAYAVYGQLAYNFTEQLKALVALRYSDETRSGVSTRILAAGPPTARTNEKSWNDVSPKFSVEWRPADRLLFYVSATHGFKSGVFDPQNVLTTAKPETIWSYEAGARTELFDDRLILNATAFHYDYKDLQIFSGIIAGSFVQTVLQNAGSARINGLELESVFEVLPQFRVGASLTLLDGKYRDGTVLADLANAIPAAPGGTPQVPVMDVGGNRMAQAPKSTLTMFADWTIDLQELGSLQLYGDFFRQSARFFTSFEDPTLSARRYDLINARATYRPPGEHYYLAAFVRNLSDTLVVSRMSRVPPFGTLQVYAQPRLYGLEVGFKF